MRTEFDSGKISCIRGEKKKLFMLNAFKTHILYFPIVQAPQQNHHHRKEKTKPIQDERNRDTYLCEH